MKDGEYGNWAELPPELTSSILHRLGAIEILENAQIVCTSWRRVCKDPSMRDLEDLTRLRSCDLKVMCLHAVDRSQGGLLEIDIGHSCTDSLLTYISQSSSYLRSLKLAMCFYITDKGIVEAVAKLPLLEELEVSFCSMSGDSLKVAGQSCPNLRSLKLAVWSQITDKGFVEAVVKLPLLEELEFSYGSLSKESLKVVGQACPNLKTLILKKISYRDCGIGCDDDALAIAETMHGLRHLQIFGNYLTNTGLNAILDNCPNLEYLDLRRCFNLHLAGDLEKRCSQRIKYLRRPNDSTHDP
ncbi:unnamed protein product [Microthlaspi erraticum]|uniref:Uncharacterized protein n=1 Tax=Microthlaspi erraticum TaxID=1685480 RepID=A0A6D2JSM3_9BRAS|nr:unnamed protein product [Microthlaspi erraticum]